MARSASKDTKTEYSSKYINLLPDLYFKKKRRFRAAAMLLVLIAAAIAGAGWYYMQMQARLAVIQDETFAMKAQLQQLEQERSDQQLLYALKDRIDQKAALLADIEDSNRSAIRITDAIEQALPMGVKFATVDFTSTDSLNIVGTTLDEQEIPDLLHQLKSLNLFDSVFLESITRNEMTSYDGDYIEYNFILVCGFGGDENETD